MLSSDNMGDFIRQLQRFNVGEDCPVFDGLFEFCQISASGSIGKQYYYIGNVLTEVPRSLIVRILIILNNLRWRSSLE